MELKFVIKEDYDIKRAQKIKQGGNTMLKDKRIDRRYLDKQYKNSLKFMKLTQKLYQGSWDDINDKFSKYVEKITGYDWFYPRYYCILSVVISGASNWGHAPVIVRSWKENPYLMRRITAHELILSHYFEIYKRYYSYEDLTAGQVWALAEIAAWALTSLIKETKEFWPSIDYYNNKTNYPHLVKPLLQLKPIFLKRKNFDEYIKKGIEIIKKYPNINPAGNTPSAKL